VKSFNRDNQADSVSSTEFELSLTMVLPSDSPAVPELDSSPWVVFRLHCGSDKFDIRRVLSEAASFVDWPRCSTLDSSECNSWWPSKAFPAPELAGANVVALRELDAQRLLQLFNNVESSAELSKLDRLLVIKQDSNSSLIEFFSAVSCLDIDNEFTRFLSVGGMQSKTSEIKEQGLEKEVDPVSLPLETGTSISSEEKSKSSVTVPSDM
jgi:hypothetical protein